MFDLTSSKLLILAIVALIVVGPKDLPVLLRTVGKYLGILRRHANEFRAQLDEAIREAELQDLRKEFEQVGRDVKSTVDDSVRAIDKDVEAAATPAKPEVQSPPQQLEPMSQPETETPAAAATNAETPPVQSEKTGT